MCKARLTTTFSSQSQKFVTITQTFTLVLAHQNNVEIIVLRQLKVAMLKLVGKKRHITSERLNYPHLMSVAPVLDLPNVEITSCQPSVICK